MDYTIPFLEQGIDGKQILGVVTLDLGEGQIFSGFGPFIHDGHGYLYIPVLITQSDNEVAFLCANPANAYLISLSTKVSVYDILQNRTIIDAGIHIPGKIDAQVCKVVFLLTPQSVLGFYIKPGTFINNLCILENF